MSYPFTTLYGVMKFEKEPSARKVPVKKTRRETRNSPRVNPCRRQKVFEKIADRRLTKTANCKPFPIFSLSVLSRHTRRVIIRKNDLNKKALISS